MLDSNSIIFFFSVANPSIPAVALGFNQLLTKIFSSKARSAGKAENLTANYETIV
jgi:hypothetical protein